MFRFFRSEKKSSDADTTGTGESVAATTRASNSIDIDRAAILSRFKKPSRVHTQLQRSLWEEYMGIEYSSIISDLVEQGKLRTLTIEEGLQLAAVKDIKAVLASQGLRVSGNKGSLIERLLSEAPEAANKAARAASVDSFILTDLGWEKVKEYEELLEAYRERTRELIRRRMPKEACRASFAFGQLIPKAIASNLTFGDGGDDSWMMYSQLGQIEYLMKSASEDVWVVQEIPEHRREELASLAAEKILGVIATDLHRDWESELPRSLETHISLLFNLAYGHVSLQDARRFNYRVTIGTCNDEHVCEVCGDAAKITYTADDAPLLPNPNCLNQPCRCGYLLVPG